MLEAGLVLEGMLHHGRLWRRVRFVLFGGLFISFLVIITTTLALEVGRSFVFVCAAILYSVSRVSQQCARAAYILEAGDGLVDVAGRELVELLVVAKDDDCDVDGTEYTQLVCLLEQAAFALQESAATKKPLALTGLK